MPYYILKYEKDADLLASDAGKLQELLSEYEEIRKQLELELLGEEKAALYTDMIDLIMRISDHVFAGRETVRKGVEEAMGGKVLQLRSEKLLEEGEAKGEARGEAKGRDEAFKIISEIAHGNTTLESLVALGYSREISIQALRASGLLPESDY